MGWVGVAPGGEHRLMTAPCLVWPQVAVQNEECAGEQHCRVCRRRQCMLAALVLCCKGNLPSAGNQADQQQPCCGQDGCAEPATVWVLPVTVTG